MRQRIIEYAATDNIVLRDEVRSLPGLGTDREEIPADGVTVALCHYKAPDGSAETQADWTVNGQAYSEALVNGESDIEVTASVAGTVEVTCNGHTLQLRAV